MKTYTINQVAKKCGKTRQCIWYHVKKGRVTTIHFGNKIIIPAEEAEKFFQFYNSFKGGN